MTMFYFEKSQKEILYSKTMSEDYNLKIFKILHLTDYFNVYILFWSILCYDLLVFPSHLKIKIIIKFLLPNNTSSQNGSSVVCSGLHCHRGTFIASYHKVINLLEHYSYLANIINIASLFLKFRSLGCINKLEICSIR